MFRVNADCLKLTPPHAARIACVLVALAHTATARPAVAAEVALHGANLRTVLSGQTLRIQTPFGAELPIRYARNGTMSGYAQAVLVVHTGSSRDTGVWWIADDRVCQRWRHWFKRRTTCFEFQQRGEVISWRTLGGLQGTARLTR